MIRAVVVAASVLLHPFQAPAQTLPVLDAATARGVIAGCAAHASARGQSHAIAVVDASGALVSFLRMDGNSPGAGDFALQKARAVAHWRFSTEGMRDAAQGTPGFANAPRVVTVPGGIPIFSADGARFLGAAGVSGEAPEDDAACATAGIESVGLTTRRR